MSIRCLFAALMLAVSPFVSAQSADQQIVSVTDSPDPVVPGNNVTYTIVARNNGPDAATNGGINFTWDQALVFVSATPPAGFTCFVGFGASCTAPSFPAGTTATFTVVMQLDPSRINFPDGSTNFNVTTSGVTPDPNNGNNAGGATTNWNSPQVDPSIGVTDSPDPVFPGGDITYTATVTQAGPDAATDANFNVYHANGLKFRSVVAPAGWTCTPPAVNAAPIFNCKRTTLPVGTWVFTVVLRADADQLGVNDGTLNVVFDTNATGNDVNQGNNVAQVSTAYVTPDADLSITASDSPDPVVIGNTVTFTSTVTNAGPDAAASVNFSVYNNGSLRFQSVAGPAPFTCMPPPVNSAPIFSCSAPSFASGASATFTVVVLTDEALISAIGGQVQTAFTAGSNAVADPNAANNQQTLTTTLLPDRLLSDGFE